MTISRYDVFTPTKPARLTFVERREINDKLVSALRTPGKQIVVYGHSGSGKTTLLTNKLHQVYESHLVSRCLGTTTIDELVLDAFDQLAPYFELEKQSAKSGSISAKIAAEYFGIKASVGKASGHGTTLTESRIVPPQLTLQRLGSFIGRARKCWVLEDFHKVSEEQRKQLSQAMKMFMDMSDEFRELKIIAIGASNSARKVVEGDPEMRNRLSEIQVPLMSEDELTQVIQKGQNLLNFSLSETTIGQIVHYSNGLASVCHQICLNICEAADIEGRCEEHVEPESDVLREAVRSYVEDASDSLKAAFDKALRRGRIRKFDNCRLILSALSSLPQTGATHGQILENIRMETPDYPAGNLTTYLQELLTVDRGELIMFDSSSGQFSFIDPVSRAFGMSLFPQPQRTPVVRPAEFDIEVQVTKLAEISDLVRQVKQMLEEG